MWSQVQTGLQQMLGSHSQIYTHPEPHLITPLAYLGYHGTVDKAPYDHINGAEAMRAFVGRLPRGEVKFLPDEEIVDMLLPGAPVPQTDHPPHEAARSHDELYLAAQASPEFAELRARLRRFVFPMTAFFLVWYATYVVLGAFAHDFMATKVWGNVNVAYVFALSQFFMAWIIAALYVRAAARFDKMAAGVIKPDAAGK